MKPIAFCVTLLCAAGQIYATDPLCPAYPQQQREADAQQISMERSAEAVFRSIAARRQKQLKQGLANRVVHANFVDDAIFGAMDQAGVAPAQGTTDAEFVRRVYVDVIGRIPTADQTSSFLSDQNPQKRNALIDQLLASTAYVDNWTYQFADYFAVTSAYYNIISIPARNQFYFFLR